MDSHEFQVREPRERSAEDQVVQRQRGLQRISDHVVEVEMRQALALRKAVGMKHDERAELFGSGEERPINRVRQFLAVDIGEDLDALQFQMRHDIIEFAHGQFRLLQRTPPRPRNLSGRRAQNSATPSLAMRWASSAIFGGR